MKENSAYAMVSFPYYKNIGVGVNVEREHNTKHNYENVGL